MPPHAPDPRQTHITLLQTFTTATMSTNKELDPYTAKAEAAGDNLTPQEKIEGLHAIVNNVKTGMLTTRSASGELHSRAMAPAGRTSIIFARLNALLTGMSCLSSNPQLCHQHKSHWCSLQIACRTSLTRSRTTRTSTSRFTTSPALTGHRILASPRSPKTRRRSRSIGVQCMSTLLALRDPNI